MAPCGLAGSAVLEPGAGPIRRGLRVRGVKLFYLGRSGRGFRTPRLAWSKRCGGTGGRRGVVDAVTGRARVAEHGRAGMAGANAIERAAMRWPGSRSAVGRLRDRAG